MNMHSTFFAVVTLVSSLSLSGCDGGTPENGGTQIVPPPEAPDAPPVNEGRSPPSPPQPEIPVDGDQGP